MLIPFISSSIWLVAMCCFIVHKNSSIINVKVSINERLIWGKQEVLSNQKVKRRKRTCHYYLAILLNKQVRHKFFIDVFDFFFMHPSIWFQYLWYENKGVILYDYGNNRKLTFLFCHSCYILCTKIALWKFMKWKHQLVEQKDSNLTLHVHFCNMNNFNSIM